MFSISVEKGAPNILNIDFEILEKNDGAAIQIIYAGAPDAEIRPEGVVVGAEKISVIKTYSVDKKASLIERLNESPFIRWPIFTIGILFTVSAVAYLTIRLAFGLSIRQLRWIANILGTAVLMLIVYDSVWNKPSSPLAEVPSAILYSGGPLNQL